MSTENPDGDTTGESPLRLDETRVYLAEWLSRQEDAPGSFSEEAIRQIHKVSGGNLDRIERLAWQCLTDPARQWARGPAPRTMATRVVIAGLAVIAIIATAMLFTPPAERPATRTQPAELRNTDAAPAPEPAATPAPAADETRLPEGLPDGIRTGEWLREEDGQQYVLQLIGAVETGTIRKFIDRSAIPERQLTLLRTQRNGGDWYVLLYGLYPDIETAREHRGRLTAFVREQNPWPRRLADVLKETEE